MLKIYHDTTNYGKVVTQMPVSNNSTVSYNWMLSYHVGIQTLQIKVLDSNLTVIDSVNVTASAILGWVSSSGFTNVSSTYITNFAKLSTGRLFAGFSGDFNPYYSDDNGVTWNPLSSFYFGYYPWAQKIIVTPTDEIFIGSELNGVFYSGDGGTTWENRSNGIPDVTPISDLAYTADGKLIFTSSGDGIYVSTDKGMNWKAITNHDSNAQLGHTYMAIQNNGDIYLKETTNFNTTLVRIDHTDSKLHLVTGLPVQTISDYYIDENGITYAAGLNGNNAELYQSTDASSTWSKIFTLPIATADVSNTIFNISKQVDGNYYFEVNSSYYKTADFKTFIALPPTIFVYSFNYIVANNNSLIINSSPIGIWYYKQ